MIIVVAYLGSESGFHACFVVRNKAVVYSRLCSAAVANNSTDRTSSPRYRVTTHLENLEKSENSKVVREKSGKMEKVREKSGKLTFVSSYTVCESPPLTVFK